MIPSAAHSPSLPLPALVFAAAHLILSPLLAEHEPPAAKEQETFDLSPVIMNGTAWSQPAEDVLRQLQPARLTWTSAERTSARSLARGQTFLGMPLIESALWAENGHFAKAGFLLYSRGDSGGMHQEQFARLIEETRNTIQQAVTSQPSTSTERAAVNLQTLVWTEPNATLTLEWSETREVKSRGIPYKAEFLRLIATPPAREISIVERAQLERQKQSASTKIEKTAVRRPNGDVVLEGIPMIDQGNKGYCVVASAERILRFFQRDVDQHELAQIANSSAAEGTSTEAMLEALDAISNRMKVRVKTDYQFDYSSFMSMLDRYNRTARRNKAPEVNINKEALIDISEVFSQMDADSLREARTKPGADMGRFLRDVQRSIDAGQPLLWSVMLGIIPEPAIPQARGGHMRIIIGYNTATNEILYSDSWGPGHEEKRMALADAWTITTGLHSMATR